MQCGKSARGATATREQLDDSSESDPMTDSETTVRTSSTAVLSRKYLLIAVAYSSASPGFILIPSGPLKTIPKNIIHRRMKLNPDCWQLSFFGG